MLSPRFIAIDPGTPAGDVTVLTRAMRHPGGVVRVLDQVEVRVEPIGSYIARTLQAVMRLTADNVVDDWMPRWQRGRYLHAHKGRKPKRGWPGR